MFSLGGDEPIELDPGVTGCDDALSTVTDLYTCSVYLLWYGGAWTSCCGHNHIDGSDGPGRPDVGSPPSVH